MKSFSLTCDCPCREFDSCVIPLLRRMSNLEELYLNISNENRSSFVNGQELHDKVLVHMTRLSKLTFYINTTTEIEQLLDDVSENDIRQSFVNIGYEQVHCFFDQIDHDYVRCHVFSFPFAFDDFPCLGNVFPSLIFTNVTSLVLYDRTSFRHEFFLRVARSFPNVQRIIIMNYLSGLSTSNELNELRSIVEFSHLSSLDTSDCHRHYLEQFLNENRTCLPYLTQLKVDYCALRRITKNFTRETTRRNCSRVKKLIVDEIMVYPQNFYLYFPLLNSK